MSSGLCVKGSRCPFAHREGDLKQAPDLSRTKFCPQFAQTGACEDRLCPFAHSKNELRIIKLEKPAVREMLSSSQAIGQCQEGSAVPSPDMQKPGYLLSAPPVPIISEACMPDDIGTGAVANAPSSRFLRAKFRKTRMCKFYASGQCKKKNCAFAHSEAELSVLPDLSCTKLCPNLLDGGTCTVVGCRFAHDPKELRMMNIFAPPAGTATTTELSVGQQRMLASNSGESRPMSDVGSSQVKPESCGEIADDESQLDSCSHDLSRLTTASTAASEHDSLLSPAAAGTCGSGSFGAQLLPRTAGACKEPQSKALPTVFAIATMAAAFDLELRVENTFLHVQASSLPAAARRARSVA